MSEIPKAYEPQTVEDKWYSFWQQEGCFTADPRSAKPAYSIVIPPPNITGMLHMGHVLNNTIQDILSRKARMEGKEVLWLPGTDHASIATHAVVEKELKKQGLMKHRQDLGREKFLEYCWAWREKHGAIIIQQLKKLGCSCDWSRERFTMDLEYSRCVLLVFVKLYQKGLIYRGKRMVNWCPATRTALSDEEVEMKSQKGFLYYFKVEIAEQPGTFLTIATTRPETIPADTGVAVNPKDPRYARFIGLHAVRPLPVETPRDQKLIPIIGDDYVDFEFGTGVLKVTPAHDKNDFEIGRRHKLAVVDVLNADGSMNELAGQELAGLDRFAARKVAAERLKELGALEKEEPYENKIGFSQRADVPIEPRLSEQWFLKYPAVAEARACVAQGRLKLYPERWVKVYDHWLSNIQDWCISRQLWWGHRIPVWTRERNTNRRQLYTFLARVLAEPAGSGASAGGRAEVAIKVDGELMTAEPSEFDRLAKTESADLDAELKHRVEISTIDPRLQQRLETAEAGFAQDPDVLDTWASSWLWPFATMGWPEQTDTLRKFYPTTDLVTGPDIIFFWVARMIMAGYEFMGEMPFHNVYFTGIIRDKLGRKMSKSLGNSPNPLELIARYSADALRFGTMRSAPQGQDVWFDEKDVELGRNFCNKLWNACRFRQMQAGEVQGEIEPSLLSNYDKWILLRLDQAIHEINEAFSQYRFSEVTQTLYRFFWSEYCDWYVEASKATLARATDAQRANTVSVIDFVLSHTLRLFHPFLPFITEELWHGLGYHQDMPATQGGKTIMSAPWPKPLDEDFRAHYGLKAEAQESVDDQFELITQGRNLRREGNVPASKRVKFIFKPAQPVPEQELEVFKLLLNAEAVEVHTDYQPKQGTPAVHSKPGELYLPLEGLIDVEAERARLQKEIAKCQTEVGKVEGKLNNAGFTSKAPPHVLEEHRQRLAEWQAKQARAVAALAALGG